jgi:A/G-specific adenine glycosylase
MNRVATEELTPAQVVTFRRRLMQWYRGFARSLPWRGIDDAYRTWVSEVMLQQTRVQAVLEHYEDFLLRFPTPVALALASENDVLAAWSGLGYYRRARMLHRAVQFLVRERGGQIPDTAVELRTLPGIGEYTCAAIASIAVVDGNVERVLLRILGRPEEASASAKAAIRTQAAALVPHRRVVGGKNAAGDHNQAMMELGAMICLPRGPLCLACPVFSLCRTRGEHKTLPRGTQHSRRAAYLLTTRTRGITAEVLLERRDQAASLMAGMMELPPLPLDAVEGREPVLRLRHAITNTNYYVEVFAEAESSGQALRRALPAAAQNLSWHAIGRLRELPLTGLARKVIRRVDLFGAAGPESPSRMPAP